MRVRNQGDADGIQRILSETLYQQPVNMVLSAFGAIAASAIGAFLAHDRSITLAAMAICAIALIRLAAMLAVPLLNGCCHRAARFVYEVGAFVYAVTIGMAAALTFSHHAPVETQLILLGFAIAYAAGISARNAGNPPLAIGQLLLVLVSPIVSLAIDGGPRGPLLAAALAILFPALVSVTLHIHRVLRNSIEAAESNARQAEAMARLARTDPLTGLLNRSGLNEEVPGRIAAIAPDRKLALIWLDLDRFKEVNDTLGHRTGDHLLREIADRLRHHAPEGALIARFGGDEFIVASAVADHVEIERLAWSVADHISHPIRIDGHRIDIAASIGVAVLPDDGVEFDSLMQAADLALYQSKNSGKGRISHFEPGMTQRLFQRREIEADLRLALQNDELAVHFQPIVELVSGRIRSFEALARWHHPDKGEICPEDFIPVAEDSGAIVTIGNWLTAKAAEAAMQWPDSVTLAINVSPLQIKVPGAALGILSALRRVGLPASRVELEITESALLDDSETTEAFIAEMTRAGARIALDDFGTGYSSLVSLNAHPFSRIKIDRSFISGTRAGPKSQAIVRAVCGMGAAIGVDVVAEGIESASQAETAMQAGCALGQGWQFGRAVPADVAADLVAANHRVCSDAPARRPVPTASARPSPEAVAERKAFVRQAARRHSA